MLPAAESILVLAVLRRPTHFIRKTNRFLSIHLRVVQALLVQQQQQQQQQRCRSSRDDCNVRAHRKR
jgi:hypothetical protein